MTPDQFLDELAGRVAYVLDESRAKTVEDKLMLLAFSFCTLLDGCGDPCFRLHGSTDGETYSENLTGELHERVHDAVRRARQSGTGAGGGE